MMGNQKPRLAQVKSFSDTSPMLLDKAINDWIKAQVKNARKTGYSTKNIQYMTTPASIIGVVTYIINMEE